MRGRVAERLSAVDSRCDNQVTVRVNRHANCMLNQFFSHSPNGRLCAICHADLS